jgi:hypothetical protein
LINKRKIRIALAIAMSRRWKELIPSILVPLLLAVSFWFLPILLASLTWNKKPLLEHTELFRNDISQFLFAVIGALFGFIIDFLFFAKVRPEDLRVETLKSNENFKLELLDCIKRFHVEQSVKIASRAVAEGYVKGSGNFHQLMDTHFDQLRKYFDLLNSLPRSNQDAAAKYFEVTSGGLSNIFGSGVNLKSRDRVSLYRAAAISSRQVLWIDPEPLDPRRSWTPDFKKWLAELKHQDIERHYVLLCSKNILKKSKAETILLQSFLTEQNINFYWCDSEVLNAIGVDYGLASCHSVFDQTSNIVVEQPRTKDFNGALALTRIESTGNNVKLADLLHGIMDHRNCPKPAWLDDAETFELDDLSSRP